MTLRYPNDRIWGFVIDSDGHVPYFTKHCRDMPWIMRVQFRALHLMAMYILRKRMGLK